MSTRRRVAARWLAAGSAAALTLAGSAVPAGPTALAATPGASKPSWALKIATQYLPPDTNRSQYDTVLVDAGVAWFLGGTNVGGKGVPASAYRKNGSFHYPRFPAGVRSWIVAAGGAAAGDVWAVTHLGGFVLRWRGTAWAKVPAGAWKSGTQFTGITAVSPDDVWVFGAGGRYPGAGTWHWSGTRWSQVTGIAAGIDQASALSATDIYAIGGIAGSMNALLRYDAGRWHHLRPAALTGFTYSRVFALTASNVWVAGSVSGKPRLGHYDGHGWRALTMPGSVAAAGMCRDGRGGLWVIANSGASPSVVLHRSATGTWTKAVISASTADEVLACALVPGTQAAWGAGRAAAPTGSAAAIYGYGRVP